MKRKICFWSCLVFYRLTFIILYCSKSTPSVYDISCFNTKAIHPFLNNCLIQPTCILFVSSQPQIIYIYINGEIYSSVINHNCTKTSLVFFFLENLSKKFGTQVNDLWDTFGTDFTYPGNLPSYMEEYFEEQQLEGRSPDVISSKIKCLPLPGVYWPRPLSR